jgi:LPPG:FO 2-phospho-L-lactate transferase
MGSIVALAGQIGGAKLADGLYRLRGERLTVIVNSGDDYEIFGLPMAPDLDTMLYTLSGIADPKRGWEPVDETFSCFDMLKRLGGFGVGGRMPFGDRSLALPILRGEALKNDSRPTEIALDFCKQLGINARVVPMSDDPVRTQVITEAGEVRYHEYFEDLQCEPAVKGFFYAGADGAALSPEVLDALYAPDLEAIVICPANPYHTIAPILAVQGMRELLKSRRVPIIAISPIVGGNALKGSAAKMMTELGHEVSARSVALNYYRLIDGFVIDSEDIALEEGIRASGFEVLATRTFMRDSDDRIALATDVLALAETIRNKKAEEAGA